MQNIRNSAIGFVKKEIWQTDPATLPFPRSLLVRWIRIFLMTLRRFRENHCPLRASALTFYTVLSIVPVAAMAFGIAGGFGVEKLLEEQLLKNFPGQEAIITQVIGFANKLLKNTRGGLIAGIGVGVLFWTVIKVLGHIEVSLNAIWGIGAPRTLARKISDYLSIMVIGPILVIMSGSVTVFIKSQIIMITQKISLLGMFHAYILFGLKLLPYGLIWVVFTLVYILMPNARVGFMSAGVAGVIAGTFYQIAQWAYINFQVGVASYNAIYGSFAALPLFLVWMQVSWLIVLFGASISASHQNADTLGFHADGQGLSPAERRLVSLRIARFLIRNFAEGTPASVAHQVSEALKLPRDLTEQLLDELAGVQILSTVTIAEKEETAYQPARDIHTLKVADIIGALDRRGEETDYPGTVQNSDSLVETLYALDEAVRNAEANRLLKDI